MSSREYVRWSEERRQERRRRRLAQYREGLRPMALAVWEVTKEHNVGSLVRTAHATGVSEVILVGERDWNTYAARTAELYTTIVHLPDQEALLEHLRRSSWSLVAGELDPRAVSLFAAECPERPCFLLGAELGGVPSPLLEAAELVVQVPQWGLVPCLNVAVAGSLVLYDHLGKLHRRSLLDRPDGGLPSE